MIAAIIVLGVLLVAAGLFIFWLLWVLKNTFDISTEILEFVHSKSSDDTGIAYDGKYYPGTVIAQIIYNQPDEMLITDFSRYDSHKIVGFTICTKESIREHYKEFANEFEGMSDDEIAEILGKPCVIRNAIIYAPKEGVWKWKSAE